MGVVLEQVREDGTHVPVLYWSRRPTSPVDSEGERIVCAMRKSLGHIGLQPVVVCTNHQWAAELVLRACGHPLGTCGKASPLAGFVRQV